MLIGKEIRNHRWAIRKTKTHMESHLAPNNCVVHTPCIFFLVKYMLFPSLQHDAICAMYQKCYNTDVCTWAVNDACPILIFCEFMSNHEICLQILRGRGHTLHFFFVCVLLSSAQQPLTHLGRVRVFFLSKCWVLVDEAVLQQEQQKMSGWLWRIRVVATEKMIFLKMYLNAKGNSSSSLQKGPESDLPRPLPHCRDWPSKCPGTPLPDVPWLGEWQITSFASPLALTRLPVEM